MEHGRLITWETLSVITIFFELVSLDYTAEIQKLLVCALLSPVQAAFDSDGIEEKLPATTAAPVSEYPLLGAVFQVLKGCELCNCKQPLLLCAVPSREASLQRQGIESYSSS